jgi:hypothetical protein
MTDLTYPSKAYTSACVQAPAQPYQYAAESFGPMGYLRTEHWFASLPVNTVYKVNVFWDYPSFRNGSLVTSLLCALISH